MVLTEINLQVIVSPQPASLPFARSMPPIEIRLQTSRASYNLSRMVGVSMLCHENWARAACMSHRPWVQQDAETLVSAINHHLLALSKECGYCGEKRYTADGVQNVLEASAVSRMHRIGSLFESEASEKQRLGASADLMLQQQRLAIKSLTSEHSGEFLNVLEPREAPLDISQISAEHLDIRSLMFNLRLVAKTSSVRFIFIASVMVFLPILALWLVFVVGSEMRIDYISHNKAMYHWETIREITAIRTALMTSHVVCLSLMVDFYAICMLLIEFVRISGVIVEISKGKWQIKRATRWTLLPRDDGMKYVRRWGVVEKPKGSRVIAHGTVQNLRSCEVSSASLCIPSCTCCGLFSLCADKWQAMVHDDVSNIWSIRYLFWVVRKNSCTVYRQLLGGSWSISLILSALIEHSAFCDDVVI